MGNLFHSVLEGFSERLKEHGYTWFDFPKEEGRKLVAETLAACAAAYGRRFSTAARETGICWHGWSGF